MVSSSVPVPAMRGPNPQSTAITFSYHLLSSRASWSFHPQQSIDPSRVLAETLVRFHVERARMRQVDLEIVGHAGRAGGEHHDTRAEEHRFRDAVRHEDDGLARLLPDAQ